MHETPEQLLQVAIDAVRQQVMKEMSAKPPAAAPQKRLLTAAGAGVYLSKTEHAVRQLIFKRQLPAIRFGRSVRLDVNDLDRFIDENRE